jgi:hypothetical protein
VLTNPSKMSDLVDAVKKSVVLSSGWNLIEFAEQMRGLTGGNIEFHTIPTQGNAVIGGADVIRVDIPEVRAAIDKLFTDAPAPGATDTTAPAAGQPLPGADAVTIDLFDGSGTAAIGSQAHDLLQGKGFKIGGDTKLATRTGTVLRYAPGDEAGLALVQQALGRTIPAEQDKDIAKGHVRVLLGKDFTSAPATSTSSTPLVPAPPSGAQPADKAITAAGVPCVN